MDFIADNYIWFIVIAVVILMAVIGYFADKTDFGRKKDKDEKKEKPKKEKKEKPQPKQEKIEVEVKGIGDISQSITEQMKETLPFEQPESTEQPTEDVPQELFTDIVNTNPPMEDGTVDESLFAPLTDLGTNQEEITVIPEEAETVMEPVQQIEESLNEESVQQIDENLVEEPVQQIEEDLVEEPVQEEIEETISDGEEVTELTDIEPTQLEVPEPTTTEQTVSEDDDIWKF